MTVVGGIAEVRHALATAAERDVFEPVRRALGRIGLGAADLRDVLTRVSHGRRDQEEILALKAKVQGTDPQTPPLLEQYALLQTALLAADDLEALPIPAEVRHLLLDEYLWLTRPQPRQRRWLVAGSYVFSALCKLTTLRRFPAGQLHWEVSGLPRSTLGRVPLRELPRLVGGIRKLGGFQPTFVPHLAWRRRQIVLSEREHYRSLARMAGALRLQPTVLGFVAEAWFYSPDTPRASPHLAWAPRLFERWGGTVLVSGRAERDSGVFENSRQRAALAASGAFRPTLGLVLWPRAAMLRWAAHVRSATEVPETEVCAEP